MSSSSLMSSSSNSSLSSLSSSSSSTLVILVDESEKKGQVAKPFYSKYASADHPEFTKPPGYFGGHSEQCYRIPDLVSLAQKCVRRGSNQLDLALRCFAELARTGFAKKGFGILETVLFEDIGPPALIPLLPWLQAQHKEFHTLLKSTKKKGIFGSKRAVEIYLQSVARMVEARKSRVTACVAGVAIAYAENYIRPIIVATGGEDGSTTPYNKDHIKAIWQEQIIKLSQSTNVLMDQSSSLKIKQVLGWSQVLYTFFEQTEDLKLLWNLVETTTDQLTTLPLPIRQTMDSIRKWRYGGSERLRFFTIVLMCLFPSEWRTEASAPLPLLKKISSIEMNLVLKSPASLQRTIHMPDWAFDKHTPIGKLRKTTTSTDQQVQILQEQMMKRGQLDVFASMTQEEKLQSHRIPEHIQNGVHPIEYFFDTGAQVDEKKCDPNPCHEACRAFYLKKWNEQKEKGVKWSALFRNIKSAEMSKQQWKEWIASLWQTTSSSKEEKEDSNNDTDTTDTDNDDDGKEEKKVKKGKVVKNECKKRKRIETPNQNLDGDEDEQAVQVKKVKTKTTNATKGLVSCSKSIPKWWKNRKIDEKKIVISMLDKAEVDRIYKLPVAQVPCGTGCIYDREKLAGKPGVYIDSKYVWKGPYNKESSANRLELVQLRTYLGQQWGFNVAGLVVIQEADQPLYKWMRFTSLASTPSESWKHSHKKYGAHRIDEHAWLNVVEQHSMGMRKASDVEDWKTQPKILCGMLKVCLFKLICEPVMGDTHLQNILVVGEKVYAIDFDDIRGTIPILPNTSSSSSSSLSTSSSSAEVVGWEKWAFCRPPSRSVLANINDAIRHHHVEVYKSLQDTWIDVIHKSKGQGWLSVAQRQRGDAFIAAIAIVATSTEN